MKLVGSKKLKLRFNNSQFQDEDPAPKSTRYVGLNTYGVLPKAILSEQGETAIQKRNGLFNNREVALNFIFSHPDMKDGYHEGPDHTEESPQFVSNCGSHIFEVGEVALHPYSYWSVLYKAN